MSRIPLTIEEIRILLHIQVCLSKQETWEPDAPREAWWEYDEDDAPSTPLMHHFGGMGKKADFSPHAC